MKSRFLSGAASAALALGISAPAYAQSRTTPATLPSWSGFYLGAYAGAAFGDAKATTSSDCSVQILPGYYCAIGVGGANAAAVNASGTGNVSDTGFNGGLQLGYNWQSGQTVLGFEADFGAFGLKGSRQASGQYPISVPGVGVGGFPYTIGSSFETDWLATYRGRLGWAHDNWLFYVTGGGALTRLQNSLTFGDNFFATPGASASGSASATKNGWVLGAGIEWMLSQNWTVKAEYLHVDFGQVTSTAIIRNAGAGGGYAQGISTSTKLSADILRLGVNYKF